MPAFTEGYHAYRSGEGIQENPYDRMTEPSEAREWYEGWIQAREEDSNV
jgi:hypothetical protein